MFNYWKQHRKKTKQNKHTGSYPEENKNPDTETCINNNQPRNLLNMVLKMMRLEKICLQNSKGY